MSAETMVGDGTESWHGRTVGYRYHKCRCDYCVEAQRMYQRGWKDRCRERAVRAESDLKAAYVRIRNETKARQIAEKQRDQAVEDMLAMREQWRVAVQEVRALRDPPAP